MPIAAAIKMFLRFMVESPPNWIWESHGFPSDILRIGRKRVLCVQDMSPGGKVLSDGKITKKTGERTKDARRR
jgi:hypothetical protein